MAEPPLMTLVVFSAALPVTSTTGLISSVDLLVANRISPFVLNMEVAIGVNSYFKTGRLLTNDAWINQVGVVHLKSQGRCGKHKWENNRSETEMVRPCGEKHRRRYRNENTEEGGKRVDVER